MGINWGGNKKPFEGPKTTNVGFDEPSEDVDNTYLGCSMVTLAADRGRSKHGEFMLVRLSNPWATKFKTEKVWAAAVGSGGAYHWGKSPSEAIDNLKRNRLNTPKNIPIPELKNYKL